MNHFKILWTFCIYNEIELLPYKIDYMTKNGIDTYIFDNMSTDGSWEWLQKHKIPAERFNSDGMFNLVLNMKLVEDKIHQLKPGWAILSGADIFYTHLAHKNLREAIENIDQSGYNAVNSGFRAFNFRYTESPEEILGKNKDPRLVYKYYTEDVVKDTCIAKYCPGLKIAGDHFIVPNQKTYKNNNLIFLHYCFRHDAKLRKTEQYQRRKKAWDAGKTPIGWGRHYKRMVENNSFVRDKNALHCVEDNQTIFYKIKESIQHG